MSLEDILKKIDQEAQQRKKAILQNARLEAENRLEKAKIDIEQECNHLFEQRMKEAQLIVQRLLAEAKLKGRGRIGKVKSEALQKVRVELASAFVQKISQSQKKWYTKIIMANTSSKNEKIFMASPEASQLGEDFINELNHEEKTSFSYGGITKDIDHGVLLKKDGMILNLSFDALLEDVMRKNESHTSEMLFQGRNK